MNADANTDMSPATPTWEAGPGSGRRTPARTRPVRTGRALALSCHPGPVAAVTGLTLVLAVTSGHGVGSCALLVAAVLTGQLSVGWCNDAYDARRDTVNGRRDKPVATGTVGRRTVWAAAFGALALCVPLSLACGALAGGAHLGAVGAAWAYNLRLKATPLSWLPYALGFASLPALVSLSLPGSPWPAWWAVTTGALLGVGAHLADVLPDIRDDLATGVRGLPHRLGTTGTRLLLPVPLVAASAVPVLGPPGPAGMAAVLVPTAAGTIAATGLLLARRHPKTPFVAAVTVAALDVSLLAVHGTGVG
ncbi:UbiA family prenyltransferase [Streptomyces sp. NBC_01498]|nr:UbiA family prenyltransferase [Streptomyces sp. NBC_01498]WTL28261.1 UbiA family prenyltransferase [Streptomyces sp. NBC_01498]